MRHIHFILYVADQQRSRDFYAAVLGFEPRLDVPGMTEFELGGGAVLGLMPAAGIKKLLGTVLADPDKAEGVTRAELYLLGSDPEGLLTRALSAGAHVLSPVQPRDWGHAVGYCQDPDGHVVAFARNEEIDGWIGLNQSIGTERLSLRAFEINDAPDIRRLAGDREIAATTTAIPHPYLEGMAEEWLGTHSDDLREECGIHWAITLREDSQFLGAVSLMDIDESGGRGELGYWIGKEFWGRGYCTEAARAVVQFGFEVLKLERIHAYHFAGNPSSGAVLRKIGMTHEGRQRKHVTKWGRGEDIELYGILRSDRGGRTEGM